MTPCSRVVAKRKRHVQDKPPQRLVTFTISRAQRYGSYPEPAARKRYQGTPQYRGKAENQIYLLAGETRDFEIPPQARRPISELRTTKPGEAQRAAHSPAKFDCVRSDLSDHFAPLASALAGRGRDPSS